MKKKKTSSILRKFLLFNLSIFSVLGLFTILYLNAIQPNLVKKVSANHFIIINNTSDHIERLGIKFDKDGIKQFLLSTRFLFQGLDRVQFFSEDAILIGDTNILDLDTSVFEKSDAIIEEGAEKGAPKYMEWYGAFGLMVTLVWLYLEILKLLAKMNSRK